MTENTELSEYGKLVKEVNRMWQDGYSVSDIQVLTGKTYDEVVVLLQGTS